MLKEGDHWNNFIEVFKNPFANWLVNVFMKAIMKLLEISLSVKLWIVAGIMVASTTLVWYDKITGAEWVTVTLASAVPIAVARESFKIARLFNEGKNVTDPEIEEDGDDESTKQTEVKSTVLLEEHKTLEVTKSTEDVKNEPIK